MFLNIYELFLYMRVLNYKILAQLSSYQFARIPSSVCFGEPFPRNDFTISLSFQLSSQITLRGTSWAIDLSEMNTI